MKISVCIATYNGEKYIHQQLSSILCQLNDSDEIIVSDDSSTDNTLAIIESFQDRRIKILANQTFKSAIYNFENAIQHATGDIIFLSDQDDVWSKNKVQIMLSNFNHHLMVISDCIIVNESLIEIASSMFQINNSKSGIFHNLKKNGYLGCTMAFKSELLKYALPFPVGIPMHDIWLGAIAETKGSVNFIEDKLVSYRRHNNNTVTWVSGEIKSSYSLMEKINFRVNLMRHLVVRIIRNLNK